MDWVFVIVLAMLFAGISAASAAFLLARHRLNRRHRVDPTVRTGAPLTWLVDPRTPARLHRRLARVGTTACTVAADHRPGGARSTAGGGRRPLRRFRRVEPTPLVATADELTAQAVALDRQLVRLSMLAPAARRTLLVDLGRAVDEVEQAAARLAVISAEVGSPRALATDDPAVVDLARRVDWLAQAHAELMALDHDAGLASPHVATAPPPLPAPPPTPQARG
ncbi:MAG: hypothetical protein KF703_18095 [Actinobacteria bacterium]|nr:hypothetical protein [Actinomycetota bacterium]